MAHPAFVVLRAKGATIPAEPSEHEFGPRDGIEIVDYSQPVAVPFSDTGVTGTRSYKPITFRKRIDRASPLIAQALAQNQVVDADFRFFRERKETGEVSEFFRVAVTRAVDVDSHLRPTHLVAVHLAADNVVRPVPRPRSHLNAEHAQLRPAVDDVVGDLRAAKVAEGTQVVGVEVVEH